MRSLTPMAEQAPGHDPFAGAPLSAFFPITESQWEIWLASKLGDDVNRAYNEGIDLLLRGELDLPAMRLALQTVLDRHECLRATFSVDGEWVMVRDHLPLELAVHDLRQHAEPDAALKSLEDAEMAVVFDLENGPLVRFTLARTADAEHHLFIVAHHAVCDGWSGAVILTEIARLYSARVEGLPPVLPPAPRYGDYSLIEREFHRSETGQAHQRWWLDKLQGSPATPDLPSDRPRPAERTYRAGPRIDHPLAPALVDTVRQFAARQGAGLVTTLLAGFATLLHRLTGSQDLVIGLSAAGQSFYQVRDLVGQCVNKLPVRLRPRPELRFAEFLAEARTEMLDAQDHQSATFGTLVQKLALPRDPSRPPLIGITFNIDVRNDDIRHTGLDVSYRTMVRQSDNFEMYLNLVDGGGSQLLLEVCYNEQLFDPATVRRRIAEFETVLARACADPQATLGEIDILSSADRSLLETPATAPSADLSRPLHRWIEAQARRTPDAVAVACEDRSLTYAELNGRANQLAHWLREQGVTRDMPVAACVSRTPEALVGFLGILKAGGAYLPLDPEYPADRLAYMVEDARPAALVTHIGPQAAWDAEKSAALDRAGCPRLDLQADASALAARPLQDSAEAVAPDALAYIIYTSGSTGRAKGARLEHRGPLNQYQHYLGALNIDADSRFLVFSSLGFDLTQRNLWAPLMVGGRVVLVSSPDYDVGGIVDLLERERITHLCCTPSAFYPLVDDADDARLARLASLREVALGGEPVLMSRLAAWRASAHCRAHLTNCYGPTEASANVALYRLPLGEAPPGPGLPIGRAIAGVALHVLDARGQRLPVGVTGELHIGGVQLARDYLGRPELTAERFIEHPQLGRLYRTGDLCRRLADGNIEFIGRADFQVKIRGFRVELGEIEAALDAHPAVQKSVCAVIERTPGDPRLVAWQQPATGADADIGELRSYLRGVLPAYMVPQQFVRVEQLPLLSSGKIDRKNLPNPFAGLEQARVQKSPPASATEQEVFDIWSEVLGHRDFGVEDRFLDIGGHSLLAVQVASRLRKAFATGELPLRLVMTRSLRQVALACGPQAAAASPAAAATAPAPAAVPAADPPQTPTDGGGLSRLKRWLKN